MTNNKTWCHIRCVLFSRSFINNSILPLTKYFIIYYSNEKGQRCLSYPAQIRRKPCCLCHKIFYDIFNCTKWGCKAQFHINCQHSDECLFMAYPSFLMDSCVPIILCPEHTEQYYNQYNKTGERILPPHLESDGEIYSGQTVRGVREGFGTCLFNDRSMYEGEWHDGVEHGFGVLSNNYNKVVYEGDYEKGRKHGNGIYYYDNGDIYNVLLNILRVNGFKIVEKVMEFILQIKVKYLMYFLFLFSVNGKIMKFVEKEHINQQNLSIMVNGLEINCI